MVELSRVRPARLFAALTIAAVAAGAITALTANNPAAVRAEPALAGGPMMQILREEHALLVAEDSRRAEAVRLADRAADAEWTTMKAVAARDSAQRIAQAEPEGGAVAAVLPPQRPAVQVTQIEHVAFGPALQEPLRLAPVAIPESAARQDGGVRTRMRAMVTTVTRLPGWFGHVAAQAANQAAGWVVELPGRAIPDRRFLSVSL